MFRRSQLLVASFFALCACTEVAATPAATSKKIKCTPKIRGIFRVVGQFNLDNPYANLGDGLLHPVTTYTLNTITDSQGAKAAVLYSNDAGASAWDFEQCESQYLGLKSTSKTFYGQLRKPLNDGMGGIQPPSKVPKHCLTTVANSTALIQPQGYDALDDPPVLKTNVTNSANCDIDDETQAQRFFSASWDDSIGTYAVRFVGADVVTKKKYPDSLPNDVDYRRDYNGGPLYFTIRSGVEPDRKALRRREGGADGFIGSSLALLGRVIGSKC